MLTVSELLLLHSQQKARLTCSISVVFFWSVHFSASFLSFFFCFSLLHSCFCCTNRSLACIPDGCQALDCIKAVATSAAACPLRGANFDLFRELYFCLCRELSVLKAFLFLKFKCNSRCAFVFVVPPFPRNVFIFYRNFPNNFFHLQFPDQSEMGFIVCPLGC